MMQTYPNGNAPKSMMSLEVVRNIEMKTKRLISLCCRRN